MCSSVWNILRLDLTVCSYTYVPAWSYFGLGISCLWFCQRSVVLLLLFHCCKCLLELLVAFAIILTAWLGGCHQFVVYRQRYIAPFLATKVGFKEWRMASATVGKLVQ